MLSVAYDSPQPRYDNVCRRRFAYYTVAAHGGIAVNKDACAASSAVDEHVSGDQTYCDNTYGAVWRDAAIDRVLRSDAALKYTTPHQDESYAPFLAF